MDTQIVLIFCLCDDQLKGLHHAEDRQSQLSDAEVMTTDSNCPENSADFRARG